MIRTQEELVARAAARRDCEGEVLEGLTLDGVVAERLGFAGSR